MYRYRGLNSVERWTSGIQKVPVIKNYEFKEHLFGYISQMVAKLFSKKEIDKIVPFGAI